MIRLVAALVVAAQAPAPRVLVVTGVGGEPAYAAAFSRQADELISGLQRRGVPAQRVTWLSGDSARVQGRPAGPATKARLGQEIAAALRSAHPGERLVLVYFGHGSDQGEPRLNLPGPDLSARDLAVMIDAWPGPVALVIAASASGGFVDALARKDRLVITATKSGFERNETRFGAAFARAFDGDAADTDKDRGLSLLEAFVFADREVIRDYETGNRLRTEHARLSDSTLAREFMFADSGPLVQPAEGDTVMARLLERRRALETEIARLRGRRATMDSTAYDKALEDLLVSLAETTMAIRRRSERAP